MSHIAFPPKMRDFAQAFLTRFRIFGDVGDAAGSPARLTFVALSTAVCSAAISVARL